MSDDCHMILSSQLHKTGNIIILGSKYNIKSKLYVTKMTFRTNRTKWAAKLTKVLNK